MRNFGNFLTRKETIGLTLWIAFLVVYLCMKNQGIGGIIEYFPGLLGAFTFAFINLIMEHQPLASRKNVIFGTLLLLLILYYCYSTFELEGQKVAFSAFFLAIFFLVSLIMLVCWRTQRGNPKL